MKKFANYYSVFRYIIYVFLIICFTENYLLICRYPLNDAHNPLANSNERFAKLLGWDNKPNMKFEHNIEEPVIGQENVDHSGRRYHGKDVINPSKRFLFLGCSYAFGTEIADEDTFIYKTAQRFPQFQFDNYSVPGYGTHQCRQKMEQLLSKTNCPKYTAIIYVFMNAHPIRMAYNYSSYLNKKNELIGISPYVDLSWDGKAKYHPCDEQFLPCTDLLRISAFFNNLFAVVKSKYSRKSSYENRIYNAVLDDMLCLAKVHELDLYVFILDYSEFYVNQDIIDKGLNVYDARLKQLYCDPKYHVNNDVTRHPNGLANDYWANRLTVLLNKNFQ